MKEPSCFYRKEEKWNIFIQLIAKNIHEKC